MSRTLYGCLALGALAILLTDSDPALAPPPHAEAPLETLASRPVVGSRDHMVVRVEEPEPKPATVEVAVALTPPAPPVPEPARVAIEPVPTAPPATPVAHEGLTSSWTTDQEDSALDPEVQVKRIDSDHDVEAVFVIDTTGSMGWIFDTARDKALELVKALEASRDEGKRVRAALVDYKDRRPVRGSDGSYTGLDRSSHLKVTSMTSDWSTLRDAFQAMGASGGGDLEEDTQGALLAALDGLAWTDGEDVTRLVYLIGDAPAKRYEDQPGLKALAARLDREGFRVHAFNASDERHGHHELVRADWKLMADATGGSYEVIRRAGVLAESPAFRGTPAIRPAWRCGTTGDARPTKVVRRPVCRLPPPRVDRGAPDLWIGPGGSEPETIAGDPVATPAEAGPPRPRKLGGLGLEVWSDL